MPTVDEIQAIAQKLAKEHVDQIKKLESVLIGKDLDIQVIKADNTHLAQQLIEKDRILKDWLETANTWEATVIKLQKENRMLKDNAQKQSSTPTKSR